MTTEITRILRRQRQIDLLSNMLTIVLLSASILLVFGMIQGVQPADLLFNRGELLQVLVVCFVLAVVAYLADSQRRLRKGIARRDHELEAASDGLRASNERLSFAHETALVLSALPQAEGLRYVLRASTDRFHADAAVIFADEATYMTEGVDEDEATANMLPVASRAVAGGAEVVAGEVPGGYVVAAPLRVGGQLRYVCCLWRRDEPFSKADADGLELVARIIELCLENEHQVTDARSKVRGTLCVLVELLGSREPGAGAHSSRVAELALAVGATLELEDEDLEDLRVAALLHDVGMLEMPDTIVDAELPLCEEDMALIRQHPAKGAELARLCSFSPVVQSAIRAHHERPDGTGYPLGLLGRESPIMARIIAVCDAYEALVSERAYRPGLTEEEAAGRLRTGKRTAYDDEAVDALLGYLENASCPAPARCPTPVRSALTVHRRPLARVS